MNIWYISKYASPVKYFFGTRHFYLAEEWVRMGHTTTVITSNSSHLAADLPKFKGSIKKENINGVETVWLNLPKSSAASSFKRILTWFLFDFKLLLFDKRGLKRPDVIIVSSLALTTVIPGWILAKRHKAKFVFEVRDIWPLSVIVLGGYSKWHPFIGLLLLIERFGYKKADLIVGTIPNLKAHVKNVIKNDFRCICIPQGVSTDFYQTKQEDISFEYRNKWLPSGPFYICYTGALNANNPLDSLIEAASLLRHENIHFIILGKGYNKQNLIQKAKGLNNVLFPPPVAKNQVYSFLNNVHVCYDSFESKLATYGLSRNKWIDYMYAAKPIICSFDGFKSMLNEADCGDFVKFGDSQMLADTILTYSKLPTSELIKKGNLGKAFLLSHRTFDKLAKLYMQEIIDIN